MNSRATKRRRFAAGLVLALSSPLAAQQAHAVPHRGALVWQRTTDEFTPAPESRLKPELLVARDGPGAPAWRHLGCKKAEVPDGFEQPNFDDSAWSEGQGEFGTEAGRDPRQRSVWKDDVLCLRLRTELGAKKPRALLFLVDHDDGIRVFLNGKQVVADDGYGRGRSYLVTGSALDGWLRGENVLAARCVNTGGAQYFHLAVQALTAAPGGNKALEDLQRTLREENELAERARNELFSAYRLPPLLLQGDLDAARSHVRIAPADLRDLGWWLAMDLRQAPGGGNVALDATRMFRLGDLALRGRATAVDADGWQTLEVTVRNMPEPLPREDGKRHVEKFVKPHVVWGFDGQLFVRRRLEAVPGGAPGTVRVTRYATELSGRILRGKGWKEGVGTLRLRESWELADVRDGQDATFRAMVEKALERGVARMRLRVKELLPTDLKADDAKAERTYHSGRLALCLLSLVKSGVPATDEVVAQGFAELRKRRIIDSYSLGNALMAVEALYVDPGEHGNLRQGTLDKPRRREPSPADLALMTSWAERLLQNQDADVDAESVVRFNYIGGGGFDNSTNQYGLLGLWSAHLCGVPLPATTWEAAANHLISAQSPVGQPVELDLVDFRALARQQSDPESAARYTTAKLVADANGWSYKGPKDEDGPTPTWGSMTAAGITGLTICQAVLQQDPGPRRNKLLGEIARARNSGFAWLAQHMTMRHHAGAIERQPSWFYYYLYSLERAALLSGVALIQDRDWYFEGAMVLVMAQNEDGSWPHELVNHGDDHALDDHAMAILFLKQSTSPVLTGK